MSFKTGEYVQIVDTYGNFRFGFIEKNTRDDILLVNLEEEGLNKIGYEEEYGLNVGENNKVKNFHQLLTESEKNMIPHLCESKTTTEIAEALGLSPVTVRCRIRDLKKKLEVDTREQLYAYAQGIQQKL